MNLGSLGTLFAPQTRKPRYEARKHARDLARRGVLEESGITATGSPLGEVVHHGGRAWTFTTNAALAGNPGPIRRNTRETLDAGWFTAGDMQDMNLMPEFRAVLPKLLALFPENE